MTIRSLQPETARTLNALSGILLLVSFVVMSPAAGFLLAVVAALAAVAPALFATERPRIAGIVLLVLSIACAAAFYPAFKEDQAGYRERAADAASQNP